MYICICNAVTDKQIQNAIDNGAATMRCLSKQLGVGNQCGKCACEAKSMLRKNQVNNTELNNLVTMIHPTVSAPAA